MARPRRLRLYSSLVAPVLLAACGTAAPTTVAPTATLAPAIILPPAWTDTPTYTPAPPTATAEPTLHPAALAARETAALWPPIEIVAVGGGADTAGWQDIEANTGSLLVPPNFQVADRGSFDDSVAAYMQGFSSRLMQLMSEGRLPGEGEATPTPLPLDELDSAFDFTMAADPAAAAVLFMIGGPLPEGFDLETMMTHAVGSVPGEVEIVNREFVGGAPRGTGRVFLRVTDPRSGTTNDEVIYVVIDGERAWTLGFQARDLEPMLPTFETVALSLRPSP